MLKKFIFIIAFLSIQLNIFGQNTNPKGFFMKDSVQIGKPIAFTLSIKYPKELEIIFPDSLYNYFPFELTDKIYFPTKSDSIFSIDSAIYYFSTFEIDSVQYLKVPVYQINAFDSTLFWTKVDSVVLSQVVSSIPDSITMVVNTNYMEVPIAFNYPYFVFGIAILLIIALIIFAFFGKKIRRKILLYRLKKKNELFITSFDNLVKTDFLNSEAIILLWKLYLEKLLKNPFTKLTTKEIIFLIVQKNIKSALMAIDRNIYGPKNKSLLPKAYNEIREIAQLEYNTKVKEITNG